MVCDKKEGGKTVMGDYDVLVSVVFVHNKIGSWQVCSSLFLFFFAISFPQSLANP